MSSRPRAVDIIEALESRLVYVPGGRDREGRPLIVVNMPSEPQPSTKVALEMLLRYSIDLFSEETKSNGFTILVDAQREAWRVARACIRQTSSSCGSAAVSVIVLRPDGFWDKHVDNCTKSHKEGEPLYIPIAKLSGYVENSQLPPEFGGSKSYDHSEWIQTRIHVEDYLKDAAELAANLSELHDRLCAARGIIEDGESEKALRSYAKISGELGAAARHILRSGKNLAMEISRESSQDVSDTVQRVHNFVESIETKQVETRNALTELEQHLGRVEEIHILEEGVARVTNWILGPADSMLNMRHRVGFDVVSSEEVRRDHEALELQCRDTYGRYAELLHKIDGMAADSLPEDLKSQRDFMDFVCRSFASRLERRRNVLITSQRFFRLVSEYFDRTSEVFDKLVMGNKVYDFSQAGAKLLQLEKNQSVLEAIEREVVKEGEKLSDVLSMPVKDALGRDIRVDYGEDIANVRDILDATIARKNIFSDSVELQKLTLKQVALIHTYENDAEQAVEWIGDLFKVLIKSHVQIGCNVNEIQSQKDEHLSFQETAKGTYDYGCQLLNGARVLRMSCRLPLEDNTRLSSRLWQAWRRLRSVGQEQLTRLRVCAVFHRSVEDHCARLRDLIDEVAALRKGSNNDRSESPGASTRTEIRGVLANREKLLLDVGRMVRLGRLLRTRLKESFCPPGMSDDEALVGGGNLTAVEAISTKLAEVTRLAERLDSHLYDAGARSDETASGSVPGSISPPTLTDVPKNEVDVAAGIRNILENSAGGSPGCPTSEFTGSVKNTRQEVPNDNTDKLINGDDYATATECSNTPVIQSRSESFATASDCGDDAAWWDVDVPASDVENVEIPSLKTEKMDSRFHSDSELIPCSDEATREKSGAIELPLRMETEGEIPEIDRSNASSTIVKRTIEEKSGKILKEVTETTTLRVSQSTHFGVTSYKLTSNTLRGNRDHTDVHEMQDLREFVERDLKGEQNHLPEADQQLKPPMKEIANSEMTSRDGDSSQEVGREHSRLLKFTRTGEEDKSFEESPGAHRSLSSTMEESNERLNSVNSSPSGGANIDDSGIETTPKEKYSKDEEEVLQKMKESGEWLELKVLEVQPSLTKLGSTVEEATELLYAHNEVLVQLQNKQSPVEELLRQADQLISTQKPRAEVYAAMADTLGQAWRDVNSHLERRKQILDSNVLFQSRAEEYRESMKALEMACNDTLLPIEIDAVKNFLTKIHDLRKSMLESLMNALQEGKTLLDLLREIANEGTLDSRPDFIKVEADQAILQVEKWLEALHDKRKLIEISFQCRKTQLEQCLALALLATDLRDLEEILNDRIAALASSSDQLGDSSASAELLLFELKKLQPEAKDFQDKGIKITKSTEQLVSSGHFAGEQATEQAYAILSACADYINDLEQYETMLNKAIAFFRSAQSALTKLDQLEIQLITTEHPAHSSQLVQLHAQSAAALEEVTAQPLSEGYALLDVTGRGAPGAEGVKRVVEDLENRKIQLTNQCTAHNEQNLAISQALTTFLETHNELYSWLVSIAEAFLQGHQDMGSNLPMARDFYDLHYQLLSDLQNKGEEINAALNTLPPVIEYLDEIQRRDVDQKVDDLHNHWLKLKNLVDARIELGSIYVKFHTVVSELASEIDSVEEELRKTSPEGTDQDMVKRLEKKWMALQPLYLQLTASGKHFLDASRNIVDPYLDIPRTCLCVETILEQFANRQLIVTESWESWQSTLTIIEELRIQREKIIDQSGQTLTSISKLEGEIYPVITSDSPKASDILKDLEVSRTTIRSDLSKAAVELDNRIKSVDVLSQKDNSPLTAEIRRKLSDVHENLQRTTTEYQILVEMLISIFKSIDEVTIHRERVDEQLRTSSLPKSVAEVESLIVHHDARRESVSEILKFINSETDYAIQRIGQQEPKDAGEQDVAKLKHFLESEKSSWEKSWSARKSQLDEQLQLAQFDADLAKINGNIDELSRQLSAVKGKYGENLPAAKSTSDSFVQFEKTITILEERIETFIRTTTETITETYTLAPEVRKELSDLKEKWIELRNKASETRRCADLSVEYFKLLEEAEEWFRDGSKLLVTIARKATSVKVPEDAVDLLRDVDTYLKPGEEKQEKRIEKIRELSIEVFGTERLPQFSKVIVENREMLDSFSIVTSELQTLVQNLKNAEDLRDKLKKEQEEADAKLNAARAETLAAQAAAAEAENARHVAEVMAARTVEKAAGEARRLAEVELERAKQAQIERQKAQTPVSTQTDAPPETKDSKDSTDEIGTQIIEETTTSHDTLITKEIHILQKTELQQAIPLPPRAATPQRETSPAKVPKVEEDVPEPIPPQFIVPLNNATIQEGERLTFECRLIGFPVPEVIWYKDSISILNNPDYQTTYDQGICTLTIEETFAEDSAQFVCKAFNSVGSAETVATLTVKETSPEEQLSAPEFTRKLLPSFATEGTSHSLECTVEGNPLPTVQWFKNESNIDNSPDYVITYNNGEAVLKFEEVFVEDQATYTCKATNQVGQASTSASLCVKISSPTEVPSFVTPLSNVMARTGQKVKLECEVRGIPPPNVSWTHDGKFVKETPDLKIETEGGKSTLIISEAFPKDAGTYAVSARNIAGEATSSSNVSVKGRIPNETSDSETNYDVEPIKPRIQLPLGDIEVSEGQSVRLDCIIVGQPEPEVIWYHDGEPVKESADFQLLFQGDRCSLIIHEAFFDDAGNYKVVAINSGGEASSECVLSVVPVTPEADVDPKTQVEVVEAGSPPRFTKLLTDVLVAEGEKTTFECAVKGSPEPELKWYLNNNEIKPNERVQITEGEYGSRVLEISPTLPEDKGNYIAKATNPLGEAKAFAHLIVKSLGDLLQKSEELVQMEEKLVAPAFKEIFSNTSVPVGNTTKFECIVTGKPTPKIQWLFNGQPVCGKGFLVSVSGDRQVLTVPEAQEDQNGTVSCVAENIAGKATCTASLEVGGGAIGVDLELTTVIRTPVDEMQSASSSEKHFTTEMSKEGGSQSILTKMSSTVTQSSHTSSLKEFSSSTTSSSTALGQQPTSVCVKTTKQSSEHSHSENGGPPVVQSHKVEEYERIFQDKPGEIRQEKTVIVSKDEDLQKDSKVIVHKPTRKNVAPRFISPVTGMIVDQGADVILEGILDGFPSPNVTWLKNGQELKARDGVQITYAHNHARVELKAVNVKDAGRYTCTATNDVGTASSTADLVVKKTVFPPVFGRRLQAQVVKRGDRVIMEVEITGSPEPTVTWYKNDLVMREQSPGIRLKNQGNCYSLIIERAAKEDAGKYMVRATNAGGEAQSIADFAVFEPTPDTMVEVHKTVVYENVKEQGIVQPGKVGVETPSANLTAQHVSTTTIQPSSGLLGLAPSLPVSCGSSVRTTQVVETTQPSSESRTTRSETFSSTIESHQSETKSEQKFHMTLEHKTPPIFDTERKLTTVQQQTPEITSSSATTVKEVIQNSGPGEQFQEIIENENVETSTIAKKDALSFFESKSKETETLPRGPKEMIKLPQEEGTSGYDVKVNKLTKNYERTTKFEEIKKPEYTSEFQTSKKAVQEIFTKLERGSAARGIDNSLIEFPYEGYKLPPLEIKQTVLEDTTASGSPIHGALTISKLQAQSESAEAMMSGFNLIPEPPPEIGYMPKVETAKKKRPDISVKVRQLEESHKNLSPIEAPIGGVRIFPSPVPKFEPKIETPKIPRPPSTYIPPPFELGKKEVVDEVCVKKSVQQGKSEDYLVKKEVVVESPVSVPIAPQATPKKAKTPERSEVSPVPFAPTDTSYTSDFETRSHISTDLSEYRCHSVASSGQLERPSSPKPSADGIAMEKSWARKHAESSKKSWPPQQEQHHVYSQKQWAPGQDYKSSSHETSREVKESPQGGITTTNIESSTSVENKSWSTREERLYKSVAEPLPPKPIIYNAETIKVDHKVHPVDETSVTERYSSECDVRKTESIEKTIIEEHGVKPSAINKSWPPGLAQSEELKAPQLVKNFAPKPVVQSYHPTEPVLEPGPPPEIGFVPGPVTRENKVERIERTLEMNLEHTPTKVPPGGVRMFPPAPKIPEPSAPPIPPKDAYVPPPPLPAKSSQPFQRFPDLDPFPYQADSPGTGFAKPPPPPTPSKFVKGEFAGSDYESDLESSSRSKWRAYESDNDAPRYRRVKAPVSKQPVRPKSTEPEPLPPSSFEVPSSDLTGPPRPTLVRDYQEKSSKKTMTRHERDMKHQQYVQPTPWVQPAPDIQPSSPPIYVQPKSPKTPPILAPKSPTKIKPESPKFKVKTFQKAESGYMADTDEPFHQQSSSTAHKSFSKHEGSSSHSESHTSYSESHSHVIKSQAFASLQQKKEVNNFSNVQPQVQQQRSSFVERTTTCNGGTEDAGFARFNPAKETVYTINQSGQQQYQHKQETHHQGHFSSEPIPVKVIQGSPWPTNGGPATKEIIQPYLDIQPKKAPLFITPLRDIAVVSGQTARFECIVQAEPPPNILWSKDGRIIENSGNNEIQYRNGVCRLSIPRAYPEDAGGYSCTATNSLGSTSTSASLLVPGNRRSLYNTK
ncbi:titin isoform X3 [Athalia rosae]|uniref:titin isoform X3 n=1 Tax=Athalia rosae TaxID=37344 RepID=UPI002034107F|nr:titin isoform X3 [Athalia rosae]